MPDVIFASRGQADVIRSQEAIKAKAKEMQDEYKELESASRSFARAVQDMYRNAQNPAAAFNKAMSELKVRLDEGKIGAEEYKKKVSELNAHYDKARQLSTQFKKTNDDTFGDGGLAKLTAFAGGLVSIQKAIGFARDEYNAFVQLRDKQAATQLTVGESRNFLIRNLLGSSPEEIKSTLDKSRALARKLSLPENVINAAMESAVSASEGDIPAALAATELAGKFLADKPDEIPEFAGALLDARKATGSPSFDVNFGLLARIGQLARITNAQKIARTAPQAVGGSVAYGAKFQEAAALFAALTGAAFDPEGEMARTGQLAFVQSLQLEFPSRLREQAAKATQEAAGASDRAAKLRQQASDMRRTMPSSAYSLAELDKQYAAGKIDGAEYDAKREQIDVRWEKIERMEQEAQRLERLSQSGGAAESKRLLDLAATLEGNSLGQNIAMLQADPELAQQFLATKGVTLGKTVTVAPLRQLLLDPNSPMAKSYAANLPKIGTERDLASLSGQAIENFKLNELEPLAEAKRAIDSLFEDSAVSGTMNLPRETRDKLTDELMELRGNAFSSRLSTFRGSLQDYSVGVSIEEARDILAEERDRIKKTVPTLGGYGFDSPRLPGVPISEEDQKNIERLDGIIEKLGLMVEAQKETNRKLSGGGLIGGED